MKKLAILLSVVTLGGLSAMAQGTIQFKNNASFPILISPNQDGTGGTAIGTASQSVALGAGPGQVTVSLYVALASAPTQFFLAGTQLSQTATSAGAQGVFTGPSPYSIPATLDGGVFTQGTLIDYYFQGVGHAGTLGVETGQSATGVGYALSGGTGTPNTVFGATGGSEITGFTLTPVPEPSMIILSGLGAAAMLLYRRKK
jgi:hypothetical protein